MIRLEIPEDEGDGDRKATIWARSEETGSNRVEVEMAECSGAGIRIAFSSRYLMELVSAVGTEHVVLETTGPSSPGVFKTLGAEECVHLSTGEGSKRKRAEGGTRSAGLGANRASPIPPVPVPGAFPNPEGRRT